MNHRLSITRITFIVCSLLMTTCVLAQSSGLHALRIKVKEAPQNRELECALCETYAHYAMVDSAAKCIQSAKSNPTEDKEILIRWHMVEAKIADLSYEFEAAIPHFQSAFTLCDELQLPLSISAPIYLEALAALSYNVDCKNGLATTEMFSAKCKQYNNDSLLMHAHLWEAQFKECLEHNPKEIAASIQLSQQIAEKSQQLLGPHYNHLGLNASYFDRAAKSIEHYLAAEIEFIKQKRSHHLSSLYENFSDAYEYIQDFQRSEEYMQKAEKNFKPSIHKRYDEFYNSFGWSLYRNGKMQEALVAINKSLKSLKSEAPGSPEMAYPVGNLGLIYKRIGEIDSAKYYSTLAIELFKNLNVASGMAEACNNLGNIAIEENDISTAKFHFEKALKLSEDGVDFYEEMLALYGLFRIYKEADPKLAIPLFEKYSDLKIQLMNKEENVKVMRAEAEFYQDKNLDHIRELQYESQLKSLEIAQKNIKITLTSLGFFIMALLSGLIFFYWFQRKKMLGVLEESNEVSQRIISMISHDFRGPLNNVKLTLELLQSGDIDMKEFELLSKDLYRQTADLSLMFDSFVGWAISQRDGYIPTIVSFKWQNALNEAIDISEPLAKLKSIKFSLTGDPAIEVMTDRMAVSLIWRNLLSNAIKYSHHHSLIELDFKADKNFVVTKLQDRGVGISEEKLRKIMTTGDGSTLGTDNEYGVGLGLKMVIKYVHLIGGKIEAKSQEGEGTCFEVSIPRNLNSAH